MFKARGNGNREKCKFLVLPSVRARCEDYISLLLAIIIDLTVK